MILAMLRPTMFTASETGVVRFSRPATSSTSHPAYKSLLLMAMLIIKVFLLLSGFLWLVPHGAVIGIIWWGTADVNRNLVNLCRRRGVVDDGRARRRWNRIFRYFGADDGLGYGWRFCVAWWRSQPRTSHNIPTITNNFTLSHVGCERKGQYVCGEGHQSAIRYLL